MRDPFASDKSPTFKFWSCSCLWVPWEGGSLVLRLFQVMISSFEHALAM